MVRVARRRPAVSPRLRADEGSRTSSALLFCALAHPAARLSPSANPTKPSAPGSAGRSTPSNLLRIIFFFDLWSKEIAASFGDDVEPRRTPQHHLVFPAIPIHHEH